MGVKGGEEGQRGTALKGLLLKWKTSQKHISRTPRELHKKRKRFSFFFFLCRKCFRRHFVVDFYGRRASQEQGSTGGRELALHSRLQAGKAEQTTHEILDWASPPLSATCSFWPARTLSHQPKKKRGTSEGNKKRAYGRRLPINCC